MKLVEELLKKIAGMTVLPEDEPQMEVEPGDTVVGEPLSENLRKAFVVKNRLNDQLKAARDEADETMRKVVRGAGPEEDRLPEQQSLVDTTMDALIKKLYGLAMEERLADAIFWAQVRMEFSEIIGARMVGLRKGWKVVFTTEEHKCDCKGCQLVRVIEGDKPSSVEVVVLGGSRPRMPRMPRNMGEMLAAMMAGDPDLG